MFSGQTTETGCCHLDGPREEKLECGRDLIGWVGAFFFQVIHFIAYWRI